MKSDKLLSLCTNLVELVEANQYQTYNRIKVLSKELGVPINKLLILRRKFNDKNDNLRRLRGPDRNGNKINNELSFSDFVKLWIKSDSISKVGSGMWDSQGHVVMRDNDIGNYTMKNSKVGWTGINTAERNRWQRIKRLNLNKDKDKDENGSG